MESKIRQLVILIKIFTVGCDYAIDYKAIDYSAEDSVSGSNEVMTKNYGSPVSRKSGPEEDGTLEDEKSDVERHTSVSTLPPIPGTTADHEKRKHISVRTALPVKPPPSAPVRPSPTEPARPSPPARPPQSAGPPLAARPPLPARQLLSGKPTLPLKPHLVKRKPIPTKRRSTRPTRTEAEMPARTEDELSATTLVDYPFSVSVQRKGAHYASGALVDKRWILTSAGEFYNIRESMKLFRARLGSVDCKKGGVSVPLKKIEIHPSYVFGLPNYDLCLLRLAEAVGYSDFIRPIAFTTITTNVISAKFMITYWPRLIVNGRVLPRTAEERIKHNSIRVSTQRLIPRHQCFQIMVQKNITLTESSLCLKPFKTHHTVCTPDAGAPVVAEDGLWGITSGWVSKDCRQDPSPTIFSRVSLPAVRSWLDKHMLYGV